MDAVVERLSCDPAFAVTVAMALDQETLRRMTEVSLQTAASTADPADVERSQLLRLALRQAVPFVGFGIFDNAVMLTVGDVVDATVGERLGFSTLAAAGVGQMASDSAGITLQGLIERCAGSLGLPEPGLTPEQERLDICKTVVQVSRILGILIGCIIGMFPLLFIDTHHTIVADLLDILPQEKRTEFRAALESTMFEEGDVIMKHGDMGDFLYLLVNGSVKVVGRDNFGCHMEVCELNTRSIFGELEFINGLPCIADVIATSKVRTQRLSRAAFERITGSAPSLQLEQENLLDGRYLYYRLHNVNQRSVQGGELSLEESQAAVAEGVP